MKQRSTDSTPWYRQFWPWVLLGIPMCSVIYSAFFITMAVTTENALVTDDYYKEGRAINQTLKRDREALARGLVAEYRLSESGVLNVVLESDEPLPTDTLILRLIHPTLENRDSLIRLGRTSGNHFEARLADKLDGRWYLDLRDASNEWRIYGAARFEPGESIQLSPQGAKG
ncbi:FixH family protein [Hydrocarboniclastica marina]|uniref:Nitrogen fixation protein FixH n=1 Tax=Hydrocarboniclastica marina TaxID=2259620 RepID=A0A4P7XHD1_9ALTE|nr:FixH family protein [Hydrocarboniclastica marina]MAL98621.1 nitrogen fixation protein FixH [Alteromonadaceae bacterium]QCF25632.1 nitrogen fixation protein FixH [Hydrocarboniclastica marina]